MKIEDAHLTKKIPCVILISKGGSDMNVWEWSVAAVSIVCGIVCTINIMGVLIDNFKMRTSIQLMTLFATILKAGADTDA